MARKKEGKFRFKSKPPMQESHFKRIRTNEDINKALDVAVTEFPDWDTASLKKRQKRFDELIASHNDTAVEPLDINGSDIKTNGVENGKNEC